MDIPRANNLSSLECFMFEYPHNAQFSCMKAMVKHRRGILSFTWMIRDFLHEWLWLCLERTCSLAWKVMVEHRGGILSFTWMIRDFSHEWLWLCLEQTWTLCLNGWWSSIEKVYSLYWNVYGFFTWMVRVKSKACNDSLCQLRNVVCVDACNVSTLRKWVMCA